jgi:hypothetical protein
LEEVHYTGSKVLDNGMTRYMVIGKWTKVIVL